MKAAAVAYRRVSTLPEALEYLWQGYHAQGAK